ncbi:MAG TPA: aminotransferase class III-fold pyridoxal phosphate-dependent enzyme [Burkholderiales bacterium]|nr:aminotransferase class III-fold pyridoxal phosphate-dependent enzyme [Burkholderiales bacterium]
MREQELLLLDKERRFCSYGDTVHYAEDPRIFERCEGCYLFDSYGRRYLDLQMWYSAANLGYANPKVAQALKAQIDRLPQLACQYLHREKIELAEMICNSIERGFGLKGRVLFNVGGSQAIEDALKLVRKSTGRQHMLAFQGGYHGRTLGASAITSSYRYREAFGEFADRAEFVPFPYVFRSKYRHDIRDAEDYFIWEVERLFEHEYTGAWNPKTGRSEFGAFFVEPVQGTGGYIIPPQGYFKRLERVCREKGILIVDDEIQMGFYRTGKMWAMEHFDMQPDIIVFGKALTNGLNPLSGIWAREELISPSVFGPGSTHSTFSSNTLGTAAGLAVMRIFEEGDYGTSVPEKGRYFLGRLKEMQRKHPELGDVDGLGLALRMEICEADGFTPNRRLADQMFQLGLSGELQLGSATKGLILDIGGYYKNVITLAPSLEISLSEINEGILALDSVITQAKSTKS